MDEILNKNWFSGVRLYYKKHFTARYDLWLLTLLMISISLLGLSTSWEYRIDTVVQTIQARQQMMANLTMNSIRQRSQEVALHSSELRESSAIKQFVEQRSENTRNEVIAGFLRSIATHLTFDYINIIDNSGMEIMRVSAGKQGALPVTAIEYKDFSERPLFSQAVELLDNQFWISDVIPLNGSSVPVVDAIPAFHVITPIVVSGKRYGYLSYNVEQHILFKSVNKAWIGESMKAETLVYSKEGLWTTQMTSDQWNWTPFLNDVEMLKKINEQGGNLSVKRVPEGMKFVYLYEMSAPENSDIAAIERLEFPESLELIRGTNKVIPLVLIVGYEDMIAAIHLTKQDRIVEVVAAILATIILTVTATWLWIKISIWMIKRRRKMKELEHSAHKDFLTGAMTREVFLAYASSSFNVLPELPQPSAILIFEIDGLKNIKDNYGRLPGDAVLKKMTEAFQIGFGKQDRIARWNEDEFVVLLNAVKSSQVLGVAERLRYSVSEIQHDIAPAIKITATVSIGVTTLGAGSVIDSIGRAEQAVRQAKSNGGNRVVLLSEGMGPDSVGVSLTSSVK